MTQSTADDLSKLQVICSLFTNVVEGDLYYANQIKDSIETALPEEERNSAQAFLSMAKELLQSIDAADGPDRFRIVQAEESNASYSLLHLRSQLLEALKSICRFDTGLVVLTGLKDAICPKGKRWTQKRKQEYEETIAYARAFCSSRSRPSSQLNLVIF